MSQPKLSILVIGYRMSRQLANTLYTLSTSYQRHIAEEDYEVIVVENASDDMLEDGFVATLAGNFRYFKRREASVSPVAAINFGFQQCRAAYAGLIIDGARMVTPGLLHYTLMATGLHSNAIVVAPGYHLGDKEQHLQSEGYTAQQEQALLESIDWRQNGYKLFSIATFSNGNRRGFLQPMHECNCLFASMANFERIGYADARFTQPGGGSVNLHMYRSLGLSPGSALFVLPGEGSFHQFHGGVTTSNHAALQQSLQAYREQLDELWPEGGFQALRRQPILLGRISRWANQHLIESSHWAKKRSDRLTALGKALWPDDELAG